jgi:hypothetical protein
MHPITSTQFNIFGRAKLCGPSWPARASCHFFGQLSYLADWSKAGLNLDMPARYRAVWFAVYAEQVKLSDSMFDTSDGGKSFCG